MKTLMVIMGVLAITTAAYGFNIERLRKFNTDYIECSAEIGVSPTDLNVEAIKCATIRDGEVLNANQEYIKTTTLQRLEDLISDIDRLEKARAIYNKCYDDVLQAGITGEQQTIEIITCVKPIMPLIDQLE